MKIKRLEIIGFKSFQDKVSFDFRDKINGIVGPNGCGKSNVVDAIRWVMGEQSAKNLRGKNMDDVIFNGSESRKPVGMAEASLIFSCEDGNAPAKYLDYSEIQVTRRLYRSGESEYLLNKTPCRLLDIAELFMDTGIGTKAYSIIEQGKIGMILHAKPVDRRFLIEEAAGVTKFKSRKQAALKKIDVTRQNLLRLSDVAAEIKRQLSGLQRQVKKAVKYCEYRDELKSIEIASAVNRFAVLSTDRIDAQRVIDDLVKHGKQLSSELESADLILEQKKVLLVDTEIALASEQDALFHIKGELNKEENLQDYQRKELSSLARHAARLANELSESKIQLVEIDTEISSLSSNGEAFLVGLGEAKDALARGEQLLEKLSSEENHLVEHLKVTTLDMSGVRTRIAQLNTHYSNCRKKLEGMADRFARIIQERLNLDKKLTEVIEHIADLETVRSALLLQKQHVAEQLTFHANQTDKLNAAFSENIKRLQLLRDLLSRKSARLDSLKEFEKQLTGYAKGVRTLLLADNFKDSFDGMVADFIEVDEACDAALEAVLGDKLQFLLYGSELDAMNAVRYLKETSGGRCTFIPHSPERTVMAEPPRGTSRLLEKVSVADGCREFVEQVLCGVFLADDLVSACKLSRDFPEFTFVTVQGDMVYSAGIISGGSLTTSHQGIISNKREIKELDRDVSLLFKQIGQLGEETDAFKKEIAVAENSMSNFQSQSHLIDMQLLTTEKDLFRRREESQRIEELKSSRSIDNEQLMDEKALLENEVAGYVSKLGLEDNAGQVLEAEAENLKQALEGKKNEIHNARESLTALKVWFAELKGKYESSLLAAQKIAQLKTDLQIRIEANQAEAAKVALENERLSCSIDESEGKLAQLVSDLAKKEAAARILKDRHESENIVLREEESRLKRVAAQSAKTNEEIADRNLRISEIHYQLHHLETSILDKYRVDITSAPGEYSVSDDCQTDTTARQSELQSLIDEMGEINLLAIEEYQLLEERFTFLSAQKEDLEASLQSLQQAIQKINRTTKQKFLVTFQLINAKFQEVFPRLFCGGHAELRLTDEEDLAETGMDIIVQPPGKKLQNVTLLSGGEKALTAVALIFSIFMIKPSPFCLLDEVDAPLDDANIGRFNEMVREMSGTSQFIIITHNKATMTVVDTLYGVTMEEPGISKVVSVKLN